MTETERTANFLRVRLVEPMIFDKRSFRKEHDMYKRFHGKSPKVLMKAKHPKTPDVAIVLGRLDSIIYEKCSDGEKYIHKLGKNTLLVADKNGKLLIVNDSARITKRGIVG